MKEDIKILFEYFYRINSGNKKYNFNPKDRELNMIGNFVNMLTASHGINWLFTYFCYQFARYNSMDTKFGKGRIMLGWIIGQKSLKHFQEATLEQKYWGEKYMMDLGIKNPLVEPTVLKKNSVYLDIERKRFYGTERGLMHCKEMNLYKELNNFCMFCKFKEYCK